MAAKGTTYSQVNKQLFETYDLAMGVRDAKTCGDVCVQLGGDPALKDRTVRRAFLPQLARQVSDDFLVASTPQLGDDQSGRLQLANWLTRPKHPLVARVMVNRIWGQLFGKALVRTVDNFGPSGDVPTHPELLDYLASKNDKLPGFVTVNPLDHLGGAQNYSSAFLTARYQGTRIAVTGDLIPNITSPFRDDGDQRRFLILVQSNNADYLARLGKAAEIEGMVQSYDLAYHMQHALPQVKRLNQETEATKKMYGITDENPALFSVQCLMARRLAEAGVRFIQLTSRVWDNHTDLPVALPLRSKDIDKPVAALIADLRQRGMLDDTLVVWGGEFGRSAGEQNNGHGRRHQNLGYTMFLAGGGVRGGMSFGKTDETGSRAVEGKIHTHDLHATILHLLGLDHERLTYRYAGRDFRLTDVHGRVVSEIIA